MRVLYLYLSETEHLLDLYFNDIGHEVYVAHYTNLYPVDLDVETILVRRRSETGYDRDRHAAYWFDTLVSIVQEFKIECILPTPSSHDLMGVIARVNKVCGLPGIDADLADIGTNKLWLREKLSGVVQMPELYGVTDKFQRKLNFNVQFPCVFKPSKGSGGIGVFVARDHGELDWFIGTDWGSTKKHGYATDTFENGDYHVYPYVSYGGDYLVEEYIPGQLISVAGVVSHGETVIDMIYEIEPTALPYRAGVAFHSTPSPTDSYGIFQLMDRVVDALGMSCGPFTADLIRDSQGYYKLVDFAPRMSSGALRIAQLGQADVIGMNMISSLTGKEVYDHLSQPKLSYRIFEVPKGRLKRIKIPYSDDVLFGPVVPIPSCRYGDPRTEQAMHERGYAVCYGDNAKDRIEDFMSGVKYDVEI